MIETYIKALIDGYILRVNWSEIQEILGESPQRLHSCSTCLNNELFPPASLVSMKDQELSEEDIKQILSRSDIKWMAEEYEGSNPMNPISARYFSIAVPKSEGPWLKRPIN